MLFEYKALLRKIEAKPMRNQTVFFFQDIQQHV